MTRAFTLIELLIVVAIIGILAAIAVPNFQNARIRATVARVESDFKTINTAMEMYKLQYNTYANDHDLDTAIHGSQTGLFQLTSPVAFLNAVPGDPFILHVRKGSSWGGREAVNGYSKDYLPAYEIGSGADNAQAIRKQAWSVLSYGPDNKVDLFSHDNFPFGIKFHPYDPSNGVKSRGDVHFYTGDFKSGCLLLNEWATDPIWTGSGC